MTEHRHHRWGQEGCGCHEKGFFGFWEEFPFMRGFIRHGFAGPWHAFHFSCGCHVGGFRRFISREERIAWLKRYLDALEKEAQAVRERIEELETKGRPEAQEEA